MEPFKVFLGIAFIFFIFCLFLAWYFLRRAKHKERMYMIEKGFNPNEDSRVDKSSHLGVKAGIIIIGLGISMFLITIMVNLNLTGKSDAIFPAIILLCTGGAVLIAQLIDKKGQ